jgi:hypothetical protein
MKPIPNDCRVIPNAMGRLFTSIFLRSMDNEADQEFRAPVDRVDQR